MKQTHQRKNPHTQVDRREARKASKRKKCLESDLEDENMFSERTRGIMFIIIPPPSSTLLGFVFLTDHSLFSPIKSATETL